MSLWPAVAQAPESGPAMSRYLLTGGSGSFGRAFTRHLLNANLADKIVIYSRGEELQREMQQHFSDSRIRWLIGDVRDRDRLTLACRDVDVVVHAAALKQIPTTERDPEECIKTNVMGALNVIHAALATNVRKVLALSSDKATSPLNLYGASKLVSEKLFANANAYRGNRSGPLFSCVRYGNVAGSRGSVIPVFRECVASGKPIALTDIRMTRFWMTLPKAVQLVMCSLDRMQGGEVFLPMLPSFSVFDLASCFHAPPFALTGIRPGEKLHESLLSADEARSARVIPGGLVLGGEGAIWEGGAYASDTVERLTLEDLRQRLNAL
jgi:UDP-N-acetylglucosamine 4,6-dehydratase